MAVRVFRILAVVLFVGSFYFWWRMYDAAGMAADPNMPLLARPVYENWIWEALTYGILCLVFSFGCYMTSRQATRLDMFLFLGIWGVALLIAVLASYLFSVPLWITAAIVTGAWFINGIIAEVEDRSPGGFLNPRSRSKRG